MNASASPAPSAAPTTGTDRRPAGGARIRVGIVGATGYVGAELIRLLSRHPHVDIVGLQGRDRDQEPIGATHAHLAGTGLIVERDLPPVDAVFLALPHGTAAAIVPDFAASGTTIIDLGPDFRLRAAADYPRWYGFEHPRPDLLGSAVYGLPELHRHELAELRTAASAIVGAPGCYPTATLLALAPLARAGLIGDLVVDAKSGVSGAGRDPKPDMMFGEVNESVKAYGIGGHRHVAEIEQELALSRAEAAARMRWLLLEEVCDFAIAHHGKINYRLLARGTESARGSWFEIVPVLSARLWDTVTVFFDGWWARPCRG